MHPMLWTLVAANALTTTNPRTAPPAAGGSAFDSSHYLQEQAEVEQHEAKALTEHGIYRVNGKRFHRMASSKGEVFLPGDGELPDMIEEFALCRQHLPLANEVVKIRDGLSISTKLQALAPRIVPLIRKCQEGHVRGPTMVMEAGRCCRWKYHQGKRRTESAAAAGPREERRRNWRVTIRDRPGRRARRLASWRPRRRSMRSASCR